MGMVRHCRHLAASLLLLALAACAAPSPQGAGERRAAAAADTAARSSSASAQATGRPAIGERIDVPPMSDPYPPVKVGGRAPVQVDRGCRIDANCAVKNVGNCCGAMPACVNTNSPTDPAGVQAQCAKDGMASVCGFAEIEGCRCAEGTCVATAAPLDPSRDPPVPVR